MTAMKFCPNKLIHKCSVLGTSHDINQQVSDDAGHDDIEEGEIIKTAETCVNNHQLNMNKCLWNLAKLVLFIIIINIIH